MRRGRGASPRPGSLRLGPPEPRAPRVYRAHRAHRAAAPSRALATLLALWAPGCAEVLDFGTVCAPEVPRVNLQVYAPDPLEGATCQGPWNGISVSLLTPEGEPDYVGVLMDSETRASSGKAGLVTAGEVVPVMVTLERLGQPLAVWVTTVDLTDAQCGDLVEVDLAAGIAWRAADDVTTPAGVEAGTPMGDAVEWALANFNRAFDHDGDGCSNLAESCRETLHNTLHKEPCPAL